MTLYNDLRSSLEEPKVSTGHEQEPIAIDSPNGILFWVLSLKKQKCNTELRGTCLWHWWERLREFIFNLLLFVCTLHLPRFTSRPPRKLDITPQHQETWSCLRQASTGSGQSYAVQSRCSCFSRVQSKMAGFYNMLIKSIPFCEREQGGD
jgi:hypothetical protein